MGSFLTLLLAPSPTLGHGADDGLAAGLHGHMLDPDHLLACKRSFLPTLRSACRAGEGCGLVPGLLVRA